MSGPEFFQTRMGKTFYEHTLPNLALEIKSLTNILTGINGRLEYLGNGLKDLKPMVDSMAIISEGMAVLADIEDKDQKLFEIKAKVNDLLEAIKILGIEAGYEGSDEVSKGGAES